MMARLKHNLKIVTWLIYNNIYLFIYITKQSP